MREIGSMLEMNIDRFFYSSPGATFLLPFEQGDTAWTPVYFNTGRSAIEALLRSLGTGRHVFLPSFICTSVTDAVRRAGNVMTLYPVDEMLQPDPDALRHLPVGEGDIVYVMQYFGVRIADEVLAAFHALHDKGALLVEDLTMSYFSERSSAFALGDILIASIRKWLPVPDGGALYFRTEDPATASLTEKVMSYCADAQAVNDYTAYYFAAQVLKDRYLSHPGKYDKETYLSLMNRANEVLFSDYTIRPMSELTKRLLPTFDTTALAKRRQINYRFLYQYLSEETPLTLLPPCADDMIPFGLFALTDDRDDLLQHLITQDIYANVHWRPSAETDAFDLSHALAARCITLPVDARYDEADMGRIVDVIRNFCQGGGTCRD